MRKFFKSSKSGLTQTERRIVRLVSAIQFISILDFQMVMPLGADFTRALGIPASDIGWVTGAYTAAAFVSGIAGARFLNKVNRRVAIIISLWGLVISTALGGLSINYATMILARISAGLFGGPVVSLSYALLTDCVPEERRGRALGIVGAMFSVASILGLPIGLKLVEWGSWRTTFITIAGLGVVLACLAMKALPRKNTAPVADPLREALSASHTKRKSAFAIAFMATFIGIYANFLLVPYVATYVQLNLGYPRDRLFFLYGLAGCFTFFTMRVAGRLCDRFGSSTTISFLTPLIVIMYYFYFIHYIPLIPVVVIFVAQSILGSARYVVVGTETSKVPPPSHRAGFMSLMSAAQALGQSLGAFTSSMILFEASPEAPLEHMPTDACLASFLAVGVVPLVIYLARLNKRRVAGFAPMPEPLI